MNGGTGMNSLKKEKHGYFKLMRKRGMALMVAVIVLGLPLTSCKKPNPDEPPRPKVVRVVL